MGRKKSAVHHGKQGMSSRYLTVSLTLLLVVLAGLLYRSTPGDGDVAVRQAEGMFSKASAANMQVKPREQREGVLQKLREAFVEQADLDKRKQTLDKGDFSVLTIDGVDVASNAWSPWREASVSFRKHPYRNSRAMSASAASVLTSRMYDQLRAQMIAKCRRLASALGVDAADAFYLKLRNVTVDDFLHDFHSLDLHIPRGVHTVPKKIGGKLRPSPTTCIDEELGPAVWWDKWLAYTFSAPTVLDPVSIVYTAVYDAALVRVLSSTWQGWDASRRSICQSSKPVEQLAALVTEKLGASADVIVVYNPPEHSSHSLYTALEKYEGINGRYQVIAPHCEQCTAPLVLVDVNVIQGAFRVLHQVSDHSTLLIGTMANFEQTGLVLHFTSPDFLYIDERDDAGSGPAASDVGDVVRFSIAGTVGDVPLSSVRSIRELCGKGAQQVAIGHPNRRHVSIFASHDTLVYPHDFTFDTSARETPGYVTLPGEIRWVPGGARRTARGEDEDAGGSTGGARATTSDAVRRGLKLVHHVSNDDRRSLTHNSLPTSETAPQPDETAGAAAALPPTPPRCAKNAHAVTSTDKQSKVCEGADGSALLMHYNAAASRWDVAFEASGFRANDEFVPFTKFTARTGDGGEGEQRASFSASAYDARYEAEYTMNMEVRAAAVGTRPTPAYRCGVTVYYPKPSKHEAPTSVNGMKLPAANTDLTSLYVVFKFDPPPSNVDRADPDRDLHGLREPVLWFAPTMGGSSKGVAEDDYKAAAVYGLARGAAFALLPDLKEIELRQVSGTWNAPSAMTLAGGLYGDVLPMTAQCGVHGTAGTFLYVPPPHEGRTVFSFDVLASAAAEPHAFATTVNHYLWMRYGHNTLRETLNRLAMPPSDDARSAKGRGGGAATGRGRGATSAPALPNHRLQTLADVLYATPAAQPRKQRDRSDALLAGFAQDARAALAAAPRSEAQGTTLFVETENNMFLLYGRLFWTHQRRRHDAVRARLVKDAAALPLIVKGEDTGAEGEGVLDLTGVAMVDFLASAVSINNAVGANGAFHSTYMWEGGRWESTYEERYSAVDMGVTVYWLECVLAHFPEVAQERPLRGNEKVLMAEGYAAFLASGQAASGVLPAYYGKNMEPLHDEVMFSMDGGDGETLNNLRPTAIGGTILAIAARKKDKIADLMRRNTKNEWVSSELYHEAAVNAGRVVITALYSYEGKGADDLTLAWIANLMLRLHTLTSHNEWLAAGDYALQLLNMYQQLWDPPRLTRAVPGGHFFGGYGASNGAATAAAWSVRQQLLIPTLADFYAETGKLEYLERAVAAAHAAFSHVNMSNAKAPHGLLSRGWDAEGARNPSQTGLTLGGLGACTAAAYLVRQFGSIAIDTKYRRVVAIDALSLTTTWLSDESLTVDLQYLEPDSAPHEVVISFAAAPPSTFSLVVNAKPIIGLARFNHVWL